MRTLELIGFFALAVTCFMWHSAAAPVADTIHGRVTFEDGSSPVAARVKWLSLDPVEGLGPVPNRENEVVCVNGVFKFEKMPKGPFRFEATARPSGSKFDWFAVVPKVASNTPNVKILAKCGSSVTGRVVDAKGAAVPAFKIGALQRYKLGGPKDKATATSGPNPREFKNDEGRFEFECLPDGEWELFIATGETTPSKTIRVMLPQKGEPITLVVPTFTEVQSILGRVVDPQGSSIDGAKVRLTFESDPKSADASADDKLATTERGGSFRFEKLGKWPIRVSATAAGFGRTTAVRLDGTESVSEIVLTLRPSCKLIGEVLDASGQPVEDCSVTADAEGEELTTGTSLAKTDAKGQFEISDLAPGPNIVAAYTDQEHSAGELIAVKRVVLNVDAPVKVKLKLKPQKE